MTQNEKRTHKPYLSLVLPVFNEVECLGIFFDTTLPIIKSCTSRFEVVCVDDGSSDATFAKLKELRQIHPQIKVLSFSRNFGKEAALTAGIQAAEGEVVVPIDVDLQDPPEIIPEMVARWQEGYDMVVALRRERRGDGIFKIFTAQLFYMLLGKVTRVRIPKNAGDYRLMDRRVVEALLQLPERTRFMKGMFAWVGFPTAEVYFERKKRVAGNSRMPFTKLWGLAMDAIFSFTTLPLRVWTFLGFLISFSSFLYMLFIISKTLILGRDVPGYASIMTLVLFMGGIQLLSLGIIGEYIGRIYRETKQRPLFIVRDKIGFE